MGEPANPATVDLAGVVAELVAIGWPITEKEVEVSSVVDLGLLALDRAGVLLCDWMLVCSIGTRE